MTDVIINTQSVLNRRYDLDWLRVLAFTVLIFYHIGMLYVANWDFHFKSQYLSQPLEGLMLLVNQWRMPLLWVISGISIRFVLQKVFIYRFISIRTLRLLLPLLFGILVIVPPQLYVEMTGNGDLHMSYWQFMQHFYGSDSQVFDKYTSGVFPHIDVNHLWYLRELWTFSIVLLCLSPMLNSRWVQSRVDFIASKAGILGVYILPLLPLLIISAVFADDKRQIGFTFLIYGYLIGWNEHWWQKIKQCRKTFLCIAGATYVMILAAYFLVWLDPILRALWWAKYLGLIVNFNAWSSVLALLGYASIYLNKPSAKLSYLNDAVLPFYILHQSLIIVLAFWLSAWHLGPIIEPILIIVGTILGCILSYELIRRITFLRPLFGLKWALANTVSSTEKIPISFRVRNALAYLILLLFALLILIESPFT